MKKIIFSLFLLIVCSYFSFAQEENKEFIPSGHAFGKVFWNYHYNMTKDVNQSSSFELKRSYFGYKFAFSKNISTKITFDVGSNSGGSSYTAYLKTAQLDWKVASPLKLTFGLMGLKQFNDQEHFWGYRYIFKSFQDEQGFGTSADMGVNAEIKPNDKIKADILIVNGGGYKQVQDNFGLHRIGADVVAKPVKGLELKVYYDMMPSKYDKYGNDSIIADTSTISNLALFAGYKTKKFRIGAEYNMFNNGIKYSHAAESYDKSGISAYATYIINKKFEVFGRFDQLASNKFSGATDPWNYNNDGNLILAGLQFSPVKGVKMALNYRTYLYENSDKDPLSVIYINFEYKF